MEEIRFNISADGEDVTMEVNGVVGPGCAKLTEEIEVGLGDVTSRRCKLEYSQQKQTTQQTVKSRR